MEYLSDVRNFYDRAAAQFNRSRSNMWPELLPYLSKIRAGEVIVDLGCGNGRLKRAIKKRVNYVGVDFSRELLSLAAKNNPGSKFILGDITRPRTWTKLPQADKIFCVAVLQHIPDEKRQLWVLRQIKAHLKQGGLLYLTVWNLWQRKMLKYHLRPKSLLLKLKHWRRVWVPFAGRFDRFLVAFDKRYLDKLVKQAGLRGASWYAGDNLVVEAV